MLGHAARPVYVYVLKWIISHERWTERALLENKEIMASNTITSYKMPLIDVKINSMCLVSITL